MMKCFECEKTEDQIEMHNHHVVPRSKGGTKTVSLCCECHGLVHGKNRMSIKELTKQALADKKAKGFRTGTVPYGFAVQEDGKLIEEPNSQEVLSIVRSYRASKLPWRKICDVLNDDGIYNRQGRPWNHNNLRRCCGYGRSGKDEKAAYELFNTTPCSNPNERRKKK